MFEYTPDKNTPLTANVCVKLLNGNEAPALAVWLDGCESNPYFLIDDSKKVELIKDANGNVSKKSPIQNWSFGTCGASGGGCCKTTMMICFTNGGKTIKTLSTIENQSGKPVVLGGVVVASDFASVSVGTQFTTTPQAGFIITECSMLTDNKPLPTRKCFRMTDIDKAAEAAILSSGSVNGHRTLVAQEETYWYQFPTSTDAGGGIDAGYPPYVELDPDGIPTVVGAVNRTINAATTGTDGAANGEFILREGYIHVPAYYHVAGVNLGKKVTSFRIYDADTTTNSDRDEIFVGVNAGAPSLDRSSAVKVAQGNVGTSFTFPTSWAGKSTYLALVHSDLGGVSGVNWRVELQLVDGTILTNQSILDWVWNLDSNPPQVGTIQSNVVSLFDPNTAQTTWQNANGTTVLFSSLIMPLQEYQCGELPFTYDVSTSLPSFVVIENANGGAGAPYQYSFDGGKTWQASNMLNTNIDTSNALEEDKWAVRPMIKDSAGKTSFIKSPSVLVTDPVDVSGVALRIQDISTNNTLASTRSNTHTAPGGWDTTGWATQYGNTHLEANNNSSGLVWNMIEAFHNASYLYLGYNTTIPENKVWANFSPLIPVAENGTQYVLTFKYINVQHGAPDTITTLWAKVIDNVTGNTLGQLSFVHPGNINVAWTPDQVLNFTGAGNPFKVEFSTTNDATVTGNWFGTLANATTTSNSVVKTAGAGWNTGLHTTIAAPLSTTPNVKFRKVGGNNNAGMFGLDGNTMSNSYTNIDYAFYLLNNSTVNIYEDGANKATIPYNGATNPTFEINISPTGTVTYLINGAVVYTSLVVAKLPAYHFSAVPYVTNTGVDNIVFNGSVTSEIPDAMSHYIAIDQVQLFKNRLTSTTLNRLIRVNNHIEARGINTPKSAPAMLERAVDDVSKADHIFITGNVTKSGTWLPTSGWGIYYRLDGGALQTAFEVNGDFNVDGRVYTTPLFRTSGIDTSNASTIQIYWGVWGTGVSGEIAYLTKLDWLEMNP